MSCYQKAICKTLKTYIMKKKILTLILAITASIAFSQQQSVTIYGYVTNSSTGVAITNHPVYIYIDTTNSPQMPYLYDQVYTNTNGYYIDSIDLSTISNPVNTQGQFNVGTNDCNGNFISTLVTYDLNVSTQMQANFTICDSVPHAACSAGFYAYPDTSSFWHTYYFADISSGNPTSWFWDFGDGTSGTGQYPVHTYSLVGSYNVCLTISGDSCQDTYCNWITVTNDSTNTSCQAYFYTYSDTTNGYLDSTIYFANASTGTNNNTSYYWDFGDGTNSSLQNPTHTYPSYGTYTVCLSIWDSICQDSYCSTIAIGPYDSSACYASFGTYFHSADSVEFVDYSYSNNPASQVISWNWSFGDGTSSTDQNPIHVYGAGQYFVCLAITTSSGCSSTYCDYVNVWSNDSTFCDLYVAANSVVNESAAGAADGSINIDVYGGTPPYTYQWSNGAATQDITGLTQGYYDVIVNDAQGCETWATFEIYNITDSTNWGTYDSLVTVPLDTCFNFPIGNAYIYSFSFINNSTIAITWIVYDPQGINHSFVTVLYTFPANGNYQVPLTIICDSVKSTFNFYDQLHIMDQASGIVSENYPSEKLILYPNPVTDNLYINAGQLASGRSTVSIFDAIGQLVETRQIEMEAGMDIITVNTGSLPKGLFIVQLINNGKTVTGRFIK
jgi:PKD repeat protein